jgi:polyhydroxybutyrate depolymerase
MRRVAFHGARRQAVAVRICVVLVALLAVAACSAPDDTTRTVTTDTPGGARTALVHHPATARPGAPLVVVLHGSRGTGAQARADFGWDAVADREGFVVAYPDGTGKSWNGGGCCRPASVDRVDDVGYLEQLVEQIVASDGVDAHRVVAAGFSNGAIMAYAWACARPGRLAGIGPVAGQLLVDCRPAALPVVAVHGLADTVVSVADPPPGEPTVAQTLAPFLAAGRCASPADERTAAATVTTWSCADGKNVVLELIEGAGHAWPPGGAELVWSKLRAAGVGA